MLLYTPALLNVAMRDYRNVINKAHAKVCDVQTFIS